MKIQPLGDRLLIRQHKAEETTRGGIVIPDAAKERPQRGTVLRVGPGRLCDDGRTVCPAVREGDEVLFKKWSGGDCKLEEGLLIISETEILAVLEK